MLMKVPYTDGDLNLLKVAQALRESNNPGHFTMLRYRNECGTPACALGHYAAREDLQDTFCLRLGGASPGRANVFNGFFCDHLRVLKHFGLTGPQARQLFSSMGCDRARTANDAADYIERFVAKRVAARTEIPW